MSFSYTFPHMLAVRMRMGWELMNRSFGRSGVRRVARHGDNERKSASDSFLASDLNVATVLADNFSCYGET